MSALAGKRVVVTRSPDQADALCDELIRRGAEPVAFPTIVIEPVDPADGLDEALRNVQRYAWVVFTSANGARAVLDRRAARGDGTWPDGVRVAAVGSATAETLAARGIAVDVVPDEFRGEALPQAMGDLSGCRVLLPRADIGRQAVVRLLERAGARIDDLTVYRTVAATPDARALARLRAGVDAVTFTSPSTLRNFLTLLNDEGRRLLADVTVATIGPVTTDAARAAGIRVDVQPDEYTVTAMIDALERHVGVAA